MRSRSATGANDVLFERRSTISVAPMLEAASLPPSDDQDLIRATLERQKAQRERVFSQDLPFSWLRLFIGVVSVAFVLTDVPRSGLGISDLSSHYYMLEPDPAVASGTPWSYSVFRATKEQASNTSVRAWSYKFDTSSVVWRAFAQHLNVPDFPACLLYRERWPSTRLGGDVVFALVDSLVNSVADRMRPPALPGPQIRMEPPSIILRTENEYYDRVHDYLLPWLFSPRVWRTNQATFLPAAGIRLMNDTSGSKICFGPIRPFFCQELWINFSRSCPPNARACQRVGHLYMHTMLRLRAVQAQFPNASVDLTFLESTEDLQVSRASLSLVGSRRSNVSTVIRARTCSSSPIAMSNTGPPPPGIFTQDDDCKTIFVDDHRYEIEVLTSDITQWYRFLAALCLIDQSYFFLRALALVVSCYYALGPRLALNGETCAERLRKTARLLLRVPTQCIVFGSPFPIACYTLAHAIDAAVMYRMLEIRFVTQNGILDLSLREFIGIAVIQMRSVWVYALMLHLCVRSSSWHQLGNGVICGVVGVPEFFLTAMSGVNIIAQFRSTRLRSTRVLCIRETMRFGSKSARVKLQLQILGHQRGGNYHLGGILIDLKFLICLVTLVVAVSMGRAVFLRLRSRRHGTESPGVDALLWPLGRTPVPYSAGILWPAMSLCVHWTSDFFCIQENDDAHRASSRSRSWRVAPAPQTTAKAGAQSEWRLASVQGICAPSIRMSSSVFRSIQHQMERIHNRSDEAEGNVAFMNLVLMSDPLVLFRLRFGDDARKSVAYYQSLERPEMVLLLPEAAVTVENEPMCYLRLMRRVHVQDLHWSELVQCG